MNIYVDENIPLMTVQALRKIGHTVFDNRGTPKEGISDEKLWKIVQRQKCLLVTTDKGFTNYRNEQHYGILIVRLRQPNRHRIHDRVMQASGGSLLPGRTFVYKKTTFFPGRKEK